MRKILLPLVFAAAALVASGSSAQIDPSLDSIGIYFDDDGIVNCDSPGIAGELSLNLILTNISAQAGVHGWECLIDWTPGIFVLEWNLRGAAVNGRTAPEFGVGLSTPLPWASTIIIMDFLVGVYKSNTIEFYILPVSNPSLPGVPSYADGSNPDLLYPLRQSTGGPDNPVCVINGDCPVPNDATTWGALKSLYRVN